MRYMKYWHRDRGTLVYTRGPEADLVWPRPASLSEIDEHQSRETARREVAEAFAFAALGGDWKRIEEVKKKFPREYEEELGPGPGLPPPAEPSASTPAVAK